MKFFSHINDLGQANYIYCFASPTYSICMRESDRYSLFIGASLSEPHIDGTTGRFHICIIIIIVRPSPAPRAWSHEVCRASHSHTWLP